VPKIAKILLVLVLLLIIGAAFVITWRIYFPQKEEQGKTSQILPQIKTNRQSEDNFKFAVCGDPHSNWTVYQKVLKSAEQKGIKFLVNLGDLTRVGAGSEYYEGKKIMAEFDYPIYLLMGGHDLVGQGEKWYHKYFGEDYGSFNQGKAHFIFLNNADQKLGIPQEQLKWLDSDLAQNDLPLVFVFLHQPIGFPYASPKTVGYLTTQSQESAQDLIGILKRYPVKTVFAGHLHTYLPYEFEGISVIITGGAGGPLYQVPFLEETPFHYVLVNVEGEQFDSEMVEIK